MSGTSLDGIDVAIVDVTGALARISHTPPTDVARALVPGRPLGPSRLVSTRVCGSDKVSHASVGMSADAAGKSARATSSHPKFCEKCGPGLAAQKELV